MHYDPVMCMVVSGSKTKDAVPNGWKVTLEQNRNKYYVYSKAMTARVAELEAKKAYPNATVLNVERYNVSDEKTIDKAIEAVSYNEKYDKKRLSIAIRQKINEENEAINSYLSLVPHVTEPDISAIIQDIANEEKVHVGELQKILYNLDPDELKKEKEGRKENAL